MTQAFSLTEVQPLMEPESAADDPRAARAKAGTMLRAAREAAGKGASELATQLKVSSDKIQALEAGEWERLPDPAFARALLRAAAKAVKADAQAMMRVLPPVLTPPAQAGLEAAPARKPVPMGGQGSAAGGSRKWWWIVGAIVVAALLIFFLPSRDDLARWFPRSVSSEQASTAMRKEPVAAPASTPTLADTTAVNPSGQTRLVSSVGVTMASAPAPTEVTSAPAAQASGPQAAASVLKLLTTAESWIQVSSRQGKNLFSGLLAQGSAQEVLLTGQDFPVQLVVGNAAHTQVSLDGTPVALATTPNNNVARLTLPKP